MATTSSASAPVDHAASARAWDRAAHASWSSRATPSSAFIASVLAPIARSSKAHHRPSRIIESTISVFPRRDPSRACGNRNGAFVIDSIPPATATSISPARIIWSAIAIEDIPDRQTLFTVIAGISLGMPAPIAACRAVICPWPACRTWPMIT